MSASETIFLLGGGGKGVGGGRDMMGVYGCTFYCQYHVHITVFFTYVLSYPQNSEMYHLRQTLSRMER
jgi:hypothetical protein